MRILACAGVALSVYGCVPMVPPAAFEASPSPPANEALERHAIVSMDALRSRDGACAKQRLPLSDYARLYTVVRPCAFSGVPMSVDDDDVTTPRLRVAFDSFAASEADPSNWRVSVVGPDGRMLVSSVAMTHEIVNPTCLGGTGCRYWASDVLRLPELWHPGVYRLVFSLTLDPSRVADMTMELTPATVREPRLFVSTRAPFHRWEDHDEAEYETTCTTQLAVQYGAGLTRDHLRYACECIAWGLEDRYSVAEYLTAMKQPQPNDASRATQQIAVGCKKSRPAALGPDPEAARGAR